MEKPVTVSSLPSIHALFAESWVAFKKSALHLFVLYLIFFGVAIGLVIVMFIGIFVAGLGGAVALSSKTFDPAVLMPAFLAGGVFLIIFIIAMMILSSFLQVGSILIIYNYDKQVSFGEIFKKSLSLVIPALVLGIFMFFFLYGALFLFIFPVFVVAILLSFSYYELVIENRRGLSALRRSLFIIKSHFWEIVIRLVLFWVITIVASVTLSGLQQGVRDTGALIPLVFLSFFVNLLISWFGIVYTVTLYKQAKQAVSAQKESSLKILFIIALVGWILATLVGFAIYNFVASGAFQNMMKQINPKSLEEQMEKDNMMLPKTDTMNQYNNIYYPEEN